MRRLLVTLFVAAGIVLVSPTAAVACSCASFTTEQNAKNADTIMVGTVEYDSENGVDDRVLGVSVLEVYKGVAGFREKVHTLPRDSQCGMGSVAINEQYVFFVDGIHPGRMTARPCGGTARWDEDLINGVTGAGFKAVEPLPTFEPGDQLPEEGTDKVQVVGISVFVLAALGAGAILLRRRITGAGGR